MNGQLGFRAITFGELDELARRIVAASAPKAFAPGDPHWKRVAKDRKRKKAAKKHKQHMRRQGK